MATIKFFQPFRLGGVTADEAGTPTVTAKRVTIPLVEGDRLVLTGRFDQSSDEAFEASTFTKLSILDDATGSTPLVAISGFSARLGDVGDFGTFLVDLTRGADKIIGSAGNDDLGGGDGDDRVAGGAGDDRLGAGAGRDILLGGDGDDLLFASRDADVMTGGGGADEFFLESGSFGSVVSDFRRADGDVLRIGDALFANVQAGDPELFTELRAVGRAVELRIDPDGGGFRNLATIRGDLGTDLEQLVADGVILFAR